MQIHSRALEKSTHLRYCDVDLITFQLDFAACMGSWWPCNVAKLMLCSRHIVFERAAVLQALVRSPGQITVCFYSGAQVPSAPHLEQPVRPSLATVASSWRAAAAAQPAMQQEDRARDGANALTTPTALLAMLPTLSLCSPQHQQQQQQQQFQQQQQQQQQNQQPQPPQPRLQQLLDMLLKAQQLATSYAEAHSQVANVMKLARRIQQNARYVEAQIAIHGPPAADAPEPATVRRGAADDTAPAPAQAPATAAQPAAGAAGQPSVVTSSTGLEVEKVQGIINNIRGLVSELQAMHEAPGVVAVQKKFRGPGGSLAGGLRAAAAPSSPSSTANIQQQQQQQHIEEAGGAATTSPAAGSPASRADADARAPAPPLAAAAAAAPASVEVDVVAHNGMTWIESKGVQVFGLGSNRWGGTQGLKQQVAAMLAVAAAPGCAVRYRAPRVVVYCPLGADADVVAELEGMGATVAVGIGEGFCGGLGLGLRARRRGWDESSLWFVLDAQLQSALPLCPLLTTGSLANLPEPHPPPSCTNLDTTTLCALVSEVSHRPASDPVLERWGGRTAHWQVGVGAPCGGGGWTGLAGCRVLQTVLSRTVNCYQLLHCSTVHHHHQTITQMQNTQGCITAERDSPLLSELAPYTSPGRRLAAAHTAVVQFEKLLAGFGGPTEHRRWREELLPRLHVYHETPQHGRQQQQQMEEEQEEEGSSSEGAGRLLPAKPAAAAGGGREQHMFALPQPVAELQMSKQQGDVFGLGIALEAVTLTANGNAVRYLADRSVALEAVVHRPVWLTGL